MKQAMKRFGAMLLTMAMLLSLAVTGVSAEGGDTPASSTAGGKTVNITFNGLGEDTLTGYQVIKYTDNSYNAFEGADGIKNGDQNFWEYVKSTAAYKNSGASDPAEYLKNNVTSNSDALRKLLKDFLTVTDGSNLSKTTDQSEKFEASNSTTVSVAPGYYILRVESPTKIYKTMLLFVGYEKGELKVKMDGSIVTGDEANGYNVTVKSENGPQIAKYVFDDRTGTELSTVDNWKSAAASEVGKEVNFAIKVTLPNYPDDADVTLTLNDTLKNLKYEGADFSKVAVYYLDTTDNSYKQVDGAVLSGVPIDNEDGLQMMNIGLDYSKLKAHIADEAAFYVYYKATLLEGAVAAEDGNNHQSGTNTVSMNYTVETSSGKYNEDTEKKTVTVYTYNFNLKKFYNNSATGSHDSAAEFSVYASLNGDGSDVDTGKVLTFKLADSGYYYPSNEEGAVESIFANFEIRGLDVDTKYYVKEVKTPAGYYAPSSYFTLELSGKETGNTTVLNGELQYKGETSGKYSDSSSFVAAKTVDQALVVNNYEGVNGGTGENYGNINANKYQYDVTLNNSTTPVLPSTGGMGTTLFTVGGVALLALAAAMLILRRRKN